MQCLLKLLVISALGCNLMLRNMVVDLSTMLLQDEHIVDDEA